MRFGKAPAHWSPIAIFEGDTGISGVALLSQRYASAAQIIAAPDSTIRPSIKKRKR